MKTWDWSSARLALDDAMRAAGWLDLIGASLDGANLDGANLDGANLNGADLRRASLYGASLDGANLDGANLRRADLSGASLIGANLDMSSLPLWCGGLHWKIDKRFAAQLAYHFCSMACDDSEVILAQNAILALANQMHRQDVPRLKTKKEQAQ